MRCLLTGASGYVGQNILSSLVGRGWEIDAIVFQNELPQSLQAICEEVIACDLRDRESVRKLVRESKPDIILHGAAMANVLRCEENPEEAFRCNVLSTENLLSAAEAVGELKRFFYLSTDMVFDGAEPPQEGFSESALAVPRSQYSRSKFQAECIVLGSTLPVAVLRLALVFGPGKGGFLGWMRERFLSGERVPLFLDEHRTPVSVFDIAETIFQLSQVETEERLYHLGGPERMSRVEFGKLLARSFGYDPLLIEVRSRLENPGPFRRPGDLSLDSGRLSRTLKFAFRTLDEAFEKIKEVEAEGQESEDS